MNPTYYEVIREDTGHLEAVQVIYDADQITYEQLLPYFWHNVNPLQGDGQFCDRGESYTSAIFYKDEAQRAAAEASLMKVLEDHPDWANSVETQIRAAATFYKAEENHQNYYKKNPVSYYLYKNGCGRVNTLKAVWGEQAYDMYHPKETDSGTEGGGDDGSFTGVSNSGSVSGASNSGSVSGASNSGSSDLKSASLSGSSNAGSESGAPPADDSGTTQNASRSFLQGLLMVILAIVGPAILL